MLLVGDASLSVVRRDDGSVVAELPLSSLSSASSPSSPSVAVQVAVCGDVDADGYSDVVLFVDGEYCVVSLAVHRGSSLFPRLLLCLLCALLTAVCAQLAILYSPTLRTRVQHWERNIVKHSAHAE